MQLSSSFPAFPLHARCKASQQIPCRSPLQLSGSVPAVPLHAICRAVKIPCRQGSAGFLQSPCSFPAEPCRSLVGPWQFYSSPPSGFLRFPRTSPGDSLQAPLQFPCSSPAGFRQVSCGAPAGSLQIPCRPPRGFPTVGLLGPCRLAVSLRIPCRSPDPCRSLAGLSQIYSDPSSGFPRFPRTSPGDSLQVPLRFPCSSPAGFLQFSCRAPAGPLQIPCRSSLAASLQLACSAPAGPLL